MPDDLKTLTRKASTALNARAWSELETIAKQILVLDRGHADAWFFLSVTAVERKRLKVAIELITQAVQLAPKNTEYLAHKARAHTMAGQRELALEAANAALTLAPVAPVVLDTLGVVFSRFELHEQARQVLQRGVEVMPDNAQFQFNLASVEQFLGDAPSALEHYQAAIKAKPDFYRAYWALSELEKNQSDPNRLPVLQKLLNDQSRLSAQNSLYLGHAISREFEKAGDFNAAFGALVQGKRAMSQALKYDVMDDRKIFDAMRQRFPKAPAEKGDAGSHNIFVLGMPRSGTTLVDRILSSHSRVTSMGEIQEMARAVKGVTGSTSKAMLDAELVQDSASIDMAEVGRRYLYNVGQRLGIADLSLDKMPLNFFYVGYILSALPAAKVVCVRRHPVDNCLSNYRQLFALDFSYYNYHYDLKTTAQYYALFDQLMAHWHEVFADRFYEIEYEALVANPEPVVRALCDYVGIEFEAACLEFYKSKAAVSTASAMQVREPLYQSAVDRWKKYGDHLTPIFEVLQENNISF